MRRFQAAFILLFILSGCAQKPVGKVLARFDGAVITEDEFVKKIEGLPRQLRGLALQRKREFIEDMATEHYLLKEARRQRLSSQPEVREVLRLAQKKIVIAKLIEVEVDKKITIAPEEASEYYEAHKDEFMTPLLLRASHILVKTPEEADAIRNELLGGADFEELARKRSTDTTAMRGGDLSFFQKGQFVPEFEQAVFALKKGELSGVVKTQFGYHVIKLTDRIEPTLRDFKAVRPIVEERLLNEKKTKTFKSLVQRLRGNSKIDVDEKALEAVTLPHAQKTP